MPSPVLSLRRASPATSTTSEERESKQLRHIEIIDGEEVCYD